MKHLAKIVIFFLTLGKKAKACDANLQGRYGDGTSATNESKDINKKISRKKIKHDCLTHPLKPLFLNNCCKGCIRVFSEYDSQQIHKEFWSLNIKLAKEKN